MSNNEIIKAMHISKTTFYKRITELSAMDLVKKTVDGYEVSESVFTTYMEDEIEQYRKMFETMATMNPSFKDTKLFKQFEYYDKNGFEGLNMPWKEFINRLESGTLSPRPQKKEIVSQEYKF